MPLLATIDEAAFTALADVTVLGKDSFIKDEKTNEYKLALDGAEAAKLATPLQTKITALEANNAKLLDEKIKQAGKFEPFTKLGKTAEEIEEILKTGKTPASEEIEKKYLTQIESLKAANQQALDASKAEIEAAKAEAAEVEKHLITTTKATILAKLTNDFGIAKGAEDYFANRIEVIKDPDTGKYVERVIENGEVAYKAGGLKTPTHLVEETRANKDFANLFTAGTAAGSGAPARQFGGGAGQIAVSREASKTDPGLYQQAKAKAAETGGTVVWSE